MATDLRCDLCGAMPVLAMVTLYAEETTSQALCIDHLYQLAKLIVTDYEGEEPPKSVDEEASADTAGSDASTAGEDETSKPATDEPAANGTQRRTPANAGSRGGRRRTGDTPDSADSPANAE